ncbi:MAG: TfoX/Sxy family protein [Alphaproteobacteria bacterium]|jgi:DNA transformation protein|nr:TfoX/Sxy family protein [Alphaproteobacteria bacterium]MBU1280430.1 TfoX/Sxy family protein [Alphaproteobacteria bacterium]MBU1572927.1 TfoX/Sxy family protein [Alphaproteobacteria bacterium]MBU1828645.1 TfoX/Sxy family protein [Alphaproteobacteria bacterium]MBU2076651.1 TfoX/Sxy family protein [Alphaproteobacteria bacterium]
MTAQTLSQRALAEGFAEQIEGIGEISVHRYFGGAGLRADGVQFGFVMKGVLYLKVDDASRMAFKARECAPFRYSGASGAVTVAAYYEAPDDILDDADMLSVWASEALRAARPSKKKARGSA